MADDLHSMLSASFDAAQSGAQEVVQDAPPIEAQADAPKSPSSDQQRARDEAGRFASAEKKEADQPPTAEDVIAQPPSQEAQPEPQPPQESPVIPRPTTWRKEYAPLWDKLNSGEPLSADESRKLAAYNVQREQEFASGIAQYKAQAQESAELKQAIDPFLPELKQHGINPKEWINTLGSAHRALALGTPQEKLQSFAILAQQCGVPLHAISQQMQGDGVDPNILHLMEQQQQLQQQVLTVSQWREQQVQQSLQQELAKFADTSKYPHFEQVREDMARLLESGFTNDLDKAYAKAVRMNDDLYEPPHQAAVPVTTQTNHQAVAKAKAAAVSVKTVSPAGATIAANPKKDVRSMLEAEFDKAAQHARL